MSALDTVIRKLESELEERKSAYEAILSHAEKEGREPNEAEKATMAELTNRMGEIGNSLEGYDATDKVIGSFTARAAELDASIATRRAAPNGVEYRSAGEYAVDVWKAGTGSQEARARLENFYPCRCPPEDDRQPGDRSRSDCWSGHQLHRFGPTTGQCDRHVVICPRRPSTCRL